VLQQIGGDSTRPFIEIIPSLTQELLFVDIGKVFTNGGYHRPAHDAGLN